MKKKYIILILASLFVFSSCTTHPLWGLNRNRKNTLYRNMMEPDFKEPAEKGEINLNLSLPYLNSISHKPEDEPEKNTAGFIGLSAGVDFVYKKNKYIKISFGGITDLPVPIGPLDRGGEYEQQRLAYMDILNVHKLNRSSFGYGLSIGKYNWYHYKEIPDSANPYRIETAEKNHFSFGLPACVYFQTGRSFYIGLIYRPTLYRPSLPEKFKYEHSASIDFSWKIGLKKK